MPPRRDNRKSELLSDEDNEQVFHIMGPRCQALVTTVVQLYTTKDPDHSEWLKHHTGILILTKDFLRKDYFFRLFCLNQSKKIWEHGIYDKMVYKTEVPFLHIFEGDSYMVAFNFADEQEAYSLKTEVQRLMQMKSGPRDIKIIDTSATQKASNTPSSKINFTYDTKVTKKKKKKNKKDKNRIKIDKSAIGAPCNFQHVSHIGFDRDSGFSAKNVDVLDPKISQFLQKAGVDEIKMRDKNLNATIESFFIEHGGTDAVLSKQAEYARLSSIAPRPPPPPNRGVIPPPPNRGPLPPPPPMPAFEVTEEYPEYEEVQETSNDMSSHLKAIREGIKLKPIENREIKMESSTAVTNAAPPTLDMISILKAKLEERREVLDSESEDSAEENDEEWDC